MFDLPFEGLQLLLEELVFLDQFFLVELLRHLFVAETLDVAREGRSLA